VATKSKELVGVVSGDPMRSLGLLSILEEIEGVTAAAVDSDEAFGAQDTETSDYAALLVNLRGSLDALIQSITKLRKARPVVKLIVMGEMLLPDEVQAVIGAGAKGFVAETASVSEIVMAVEVVLDGSIWAPRKVLAALIESGGGASGQGNGTALPIEPMLTDRERDVLNLLMNGRSNREIAAAMGIEPATVKAHLGRMLRKTQATNRVELTLRAMEERAALDRGEA
jgi:DNA-binding NarL/FixJ family response regulator